MKKRMLRLTALLLALLLALTACTAESLLQIAETLNEAAGQPEQYEQPIEEASELTEEAAKPAEERSADAAEVVFGEAYDTPETVATYLHLYRELPPNYITKSDAQDRGWDSSKGNLRDAAPGCSIGGDTFGNREGLLPEGKYHECDVNYTGGYRGGERIVWSADGAIYYTDDHYESFTQLYEGWAS